MPDLNLYERIKNIQKDYLDLPELPHFIFENINQYFKLRPYQIESLQYFLFYLNEFRHRVYPSQLLFHMATGSGKTLIMAAAMIYLYQQGYRNFIFFVDSTTIIEKTKDNFLNPTSTKYLFAKNIKIDGEVITINPVDNFQFSSPHCINIVFSTIQGLHTTLNNPRENTLTYIDFEDKKIVLISDEAHHINALTKSKKSRSDQENLKSWEATVDRIFHSNPDNLLLEFTATIQMSHEAIAEKFKDKIVYDYQLKRFREDGYSKDVQTLSTDIPKMERAIQAVLISQYRKKVAERHQIALKPVVMMKANYVNQPTQPDENKVVSEEFRKNFHQKIDTLTVNDLAAIRDNSTQPVVKQAFQFFSDQSIALENLIIEIKNDFSEEKALSIDSKSDNEEHQILVNSLEDPKNDIRVVFAVEMLNEGWDVLNLFDIVRLYDTRDAKNGVPGNTTISEAQLIGRGARYYPFQLNDEQPKFKRKFDDEEENPLRILEVLYYHSAHNPRYIQELHTALTEIGMRPQNNVRQLRLDLKESFKESDLWKQGVLLQNSRVRNDSSKIFEIKDSLIEKAYTYRMMTGHGIEQDLLDEVIQKEEPRTITKTIRINSFSIHLLRSALARVKFYEFRNLMHYFPNLSSITEFISSDNYLGRINVDITGIETRIDNLDPDSKLHIAIDVFQHLADDIRKGTPQYIGTPDFKSVRVKDVVKEKVEFKREYNPITDVGTGMRETANAEYHADLREEDWYVYDENYGTSEEKALVKFIQSQIPELEKYYREVYLLRNQKLFQIYDFEEGRPFEPDFVLFLSEKGTGKQLHYQLFIEPKGDVYIANDQWKEDFMLQIRDKAKININLPKHDFMVVGLPFYNIGNKHIFEKAFAEILLEDY